jgi:sialate O-acetylesterase
LYDAAGLASSFLQTLFPEHALMNGLMKLPRLLPRLMAIVTVAIVALPLHAGPLPKEDVVDVPAVGDGLWVSNVFQTNMVLQRDKPIFVWGWAEPGETVTVTFAGKSTTAKAGNDRAWKAELPALPADAKPQAMTVKGNDKTVTLENILVGDVWVLGGQSNMEHPIRAVEDGGLEIASANYPNIRILSVPQGELQEPAAAFPRLQEWIGFFGQHFRKGYWDVCSPETVREFSAIGYVFARRVHQAGKVPIGVIDLSRGGTTVESWTPLDVLRGMDNPWIKKVLAEWDQKVAEFDPKKDLETRIAQQEQRLAKMKAEGKAIKDEQRVLPSDLRPGPIADPNHPGANYHGMLKPVAGLSVKGALWHQGYNNALGGANGPWMYREVFPEMITAWRAAFGDPAMPFCILSLCTQGEPQTLDDYSEKMLDLGIEIREVQYDTFRDFEKAGDKTIGYVSTFDLRRRWYHPQLKIPAGERAAKWALATQYGVSERDVPWRPPVITTMEAKDGSIIVTLDQSVKDPEDGAMRGFAIAGNDRKFHPAKVEYVETGRDAHNRPQLDRKALKLTSVMVPEPVAYRYAWGRSPLANIKAEGDFNMIPLATQRSDDWPILSVPTGVVAENAEMPPSRADMGKISQALRAMDKERRLREAELTIQELGKPK